MIGRITAIVVLLFIAAPGVISADSPPDFEIEKAHFYAQGAGPTSSSGLKGYIVANSDDALMLAGFEKLGGVPELGYPISRRFIWRDHITQVTQRAVLQWDDEQEKVVILDIFDQLSSAGFDETLHKQKSIPRRIAAVAADRTVNPDDLADSRMNLLHEDAVIKAHYESTPYASRLYGLPTSHAEDFGAFVAMRFQRAVLQHWKVNTDFAQVDDVIPVNAGLMTKEMGILSGVNWEPEDAPSDDSDELRLMASSRGSLAPSRGVATWYGADFQGEPMKNGDPYDMNDATTTACNTYAIGTRLKVTRVSTGKSIIVTVTDTGAFRYPIVVDLSHAAFAQLADPDTGVIRVVVEPLRN